MSLNADLVRARCGEIEESLLQMARFRNLLVHVYWRIDYGRVYDVLARDLGDLRAFVGVVSQLV